MQMNAYYLWDIKRLPTFAYDTAIRIRDCDQEHIPHEHVKLNNLYFTLFYFVLSAPLHLKSNGVKMLFHIQQICQLNGEWLFSSKINIRVNVVLDSAFRVT